MPDIWPLKITKMTGLSKIDRAILDSKFQIQDYRTSINLESGIFNPPSASVTLAKEGHNHTAVPLCR